MVNKLWLLGLLIVTLFFGPVALLGWGDTVLSSDKVIESDVLKANDRVIVSSTVKGDVLAFGSTIRSEGHITNDLLALGNDVIHSGRIEGNARLAGRNIFLDGTVDKNLSLAAINLTVNQGALVKGNLLAVGSTITIKGKVGGGLIVKGDNVVLSGEVGKDVEVYANSLTILPRAKFAGKVAYFGPKPAKVSPVATFATPLTYRPVRTTIKAWQQWLTSLAGILLLALITVGLFPKGFSRVSDKLLHKPVQNFLRGLVFLGVVPPLFVLLLWSSVGRTSGLALVSAYIGAGALALLLGQIAWGSLLGKLIWRFWDKQGTLTNWSANLTSLVQTLLGTFLLQCISPVPYLGKFLLLMYMVSTLGSLLVLVASGARWPRTPSAQQSTASM